MAFGLTKEQIQQFYRPATPQITDEEKNSLRQMISDTYNSNAIAPTETQNAFVNPTLTDEQRQSAINFINTVYNGASQTTSNSTSTPSTSTLPVLKKSDDAPIKKEEKKKPNLSLVSDAQKSREQAIADAVRVNRVEETQNARQKAIDEARQREIDRNTIEKEEEEVATPTYDTDILGNNLKVGTLVRPTPTAELESGKDWVKEQAIKNKYKGATPENITQEDVKKAKDTFEKQTLENRAKETKTETIDRFLDPTKKLNEREENQAKKIINDYENSEVGRINENYYTSDEDGNVIPVNRELTADEKAYRDKVYALKDKVSNASAVTYGVMDALPGMTTLQKALGNDELIQSKEQSQMQNPVAYTAGLLGTGLATNSLAQSQLANTKYARDIYNAVDKVFPKMGTLGKNIIAESLEDAPIDLALDTIPQLVNDIASGEDAGTVAKNTALNLGINALLNVGASTLGNIGDMAKKSNNISSQNNVDDVVSNAIKNNEGTPKTISQIGEDIQNANISQVRKQPKRVGKFTTIQSPYDGEIPTQKIKERKG